ncbi:MAG: DUF1552 domain-containing protein [Planctomycetaceae bacterium]|nr:DUF1552 domain-containing protein [Planctomycetaceae bacterium]
MRASLSPLLWPFLDQTLFAAEAKRPPRFLFVVKSSGLTPAELVPQEWRAAKVTKGEERGWPDRLRPSDSLIDLSLQDKRLSPSLRSLESLKDHLTILQGLSGKMCRGGHSAWYGAMGCYLTGDEGSPGRPVYPTVDGRLAKALPAIFPHVGLTLGGKVLSGVKDSVVYPGISAIDTDRPLPYQASPSMAYQNLFGIAVRGKQAQAKQKLKTMLLDHMVGDVRRLQRDIGSADQEKLDHYLAAFEGLRDRRRELKGLEATIRKHAPTVTDKYVSDIETDRIEAHFDIAAATLISGLSNVVTVRADTLDVTYRGLGISKHVHGIGHAESVDGMTPVDARNRIREFHVDQIARVAAKLAAVPEADGSMLDNTLIVYFSDAAEKHHGSCVEWPFVLVGGLRGKLRATRGGRYLQFPEYGQSGHRTIASLYLSLMHAVGQTQDEFGNRDLNLSKDSQLGPLSELLLSSVQR